MTPLVIPYPDIGDTIFQIGPFALRWYALAYIAGLVLGWRYVVRMVRNPSLWRPGTAHAPPATVAQIDDLLLWITLGVVLGGRVGYVLLYGLVYEADYYLANPLRVFEIWKGGMSFHGGLTGVILAVILFCRAQKIDMVKVGDLVAAATPIGLFFGRIANFINGELYGRPSNVPWAMIFPHDREQVPRHPSQLYEAALEGLVLFAILRFVTHHTRALEKPGLAIAIFLAGYGIFRAFVEFFRDPANPIGDTGLTMGMLLSLPMWLGAAFFFWFALKRVAPPTTTTTPPAKPKP